MGTDTMISLLTWVSRRYIKLDISKSKLIYWPPYLLLYLDSMFFPVTVFQVAQNRQYLSATAIIKQFNKPPQNSVAYN